MNRRRFLETAALAPLAPQVARSAPTPTGRMKCGTQHNSTDEVLTIMAALGVNHVCSTLPSPKFDAAWSVEGLSKLRERVESHGITLEAVPLPLSSAYITKSENPNIMLGKSPERDREIENIQQMIRNAARAGIPELKYNMSILGVVRTGTSTGRGGAKLSTCRTLPSPKPAPSARIRPGSASLIFLSESSRLPKRIRSGWHAILTIPVCLVIKDSAGFTASWATSTDSRNSSRSRKARITA